MHRDDAAVRRLRTRRSPDIVGLDLVKEVMPQQSRSWNDGWNAYVRAPITPGYDSLHQPLSDNSRGPHVVAVDYGMKWNIPRHLRQLGCRVTVVPGDTIQFASLFIRELK